MQATLARIESLRTHPAPQRVAVVLNGNARLVNERVVRRVASLVDPADLHVSRSLDQARLVARRIARQGHDVVLCGGGDGTFCQTVTDVLALHPRPAPAFGVLRLGTGNALASVLGASGAERAALAQDLALARSGQARRRLPLLSVEGRLAPFAGLGLDALILQDYNASRRLLEGLPLGRALGEGPAGYALSIALRSLPRYLLEPLPEVVIRNAGEPAWRVDLKGRPQGHPIPRGGILYRGAVTIAAASTIPFYGLGLRLFPQAEVRSDRFQLRVGQIDAATVLANLTALFAGTLSDPRIHDYLCTAITIHCEAGTPFQIGGDLIGLRNTVLISSTRIEAVVGGRARPAEGAPARAAAHAA